MTDRQLEEFYNNIADFEEFMVKVNAAQDFLTDKLKVHFTDNYTVVITLTDSVEYVPLHKFQRLTVELCAQWKSDKTFAEIKNNKIYDFEINVRDDRTFVITDKFVEMLIHGREISSGHNWYLNQIRTILRLLESGYTLIHNDKLVNTKQEFTDKYLKGLSEFVSMEKELE
ncbi:MAG: hypothetical protein R2804_07790 [Cyclobacteriaceae bacterium]